MKLIQYAFRGFLDCHKPDEGIKTKSLVIELSLSGNYFFFVMKTLVGKEKLVVTGNFEFDIKRNQQIFLMISSTIGMMMEGSKK